MKEEIEKVSATVGNGEGEIPDDKARANFKDKANEHMETAEHMFFCSVIENCGVEDHHEMAMICHASKSMIIKMIVELIDHYNIEREVAMQLVLNKMVRE